MSRYCDSLEVRGQWLGIRKKIQLEWRRVTLRLISKEGPVIWKLSGCRQPEAKIRQLMQK
jgi:hypothetical protein